MRKARLKITESVLQQKIVTYSHRKVVNVYAVYEITNFHGIENYPTLANALFGAVKLTKNAEQLKFPTIIIRCIFQNGKKLYPQIYLDECLCESI